MELRYILILLCLASVTAIVTSSHHRIRQDDSESKANKQKKCKCKDRGHRRLRRKIENVVFSNCKDFTHPRFVDIYNITLLPKPIIAPGELFVRFDMDIVHTLPPNIQVDVDVHKYMFNLPFRVLCTTINDDLRFGSCMYTDVCNTIKTSGCLAFQRNGIPCNCQSLQPGTYSFLQPIGFTIPNISEMFDVLVKGDYIMRAEFTDSRTKQPFGCLQATWSITKVHKSKDFLSLFGRRKRMK